MAEVRDFSVILLLVLVGICAYLANVRAISGTAFAGSLVACAISVVLIRNVDRLEQLVVRRGDDQVLVQIKQIQKDVYAKVEELQKIAAGIAAFTTASIVAENRFAGLDHQERCFGGATSWRGFSLTPASRNPGDSTFDERS
jgi:hypothetical protein